MALRAHGVPLILLSLFIVLVTSQQAATAQSTDQNFRIWTPITLTFPTPVKRVRGWFEVQPRFYEEGKGLNQLLLRPGLTFQIHRNVNVTAGYLYLTQYRPFDEEQRLWQQVAFRGKLRWLQLESRNRIEQRFIDHVPTTSVRLRPLIRASVPLGRTNFYLTTFDELFLNLNSAEGGPQAGVDQNRYYVGLGRKLFKKFRVETGYQWQYINRTDVFDQGNHCLVFNFFGDF